MKAAFLFIGLVLSFAGYAQHLLPPADWTSVDGLIEKEVRKGPAVNFDKKKRQLGNDLSDDEVLKLLLDDQQGELTIQFSEKEYYFNKQIKLKSNQSIVGAGTETKFIFNLEKEQHLILVQGQITTDTLKLGMGVDMLTDISYSAQPIDKIKLDGFYLLSDNDGELVTSWWAKGKTGQIVKISEVGDGYLRFDEEVRRDYNAEANLVKLLPAQNVEISNLTIINRSQTESQTANICFRYAYNCLVKNVNSIRSNYAHILFEFTAHSGVKQSKMVKAHSYGNGGKGYGVAFQFATSSCFVYQCEFDSLRHSIILQAGASHNYIAYNESKNPYWTDVNLPAKSAGDIVLHGNFTYVNLFEFNKCQTIVIDNSHGFNGPYNTFFNNEITGYGVWQLRGAACGPQYFINNILTGDKVRFRAKDKDFHQYNSVNGKLINSKDTKHQYESMIQGFVRY